MEYVKKPDSEFIIDYFNNRIRLKRYNPFKIPVIVQNLISTAEEQRLGKIIVYARDEDTKAFLEAGLVEEGKIPGFFKGQNANCCSLFVDKNRATSTQKQTADDIIAQLFSEGRTKLDTTKLPSGFSLQKPNKDDVLPMAELFAKVFSSYPTPITDHQYLAKVMGTTSEFIVIKYGTDIVSIGSCELDIENKAAELTDCATHPDFRGKGLLTFIAQQLVNEMKEKRFITLYSLARATSFGISKVMYNLGFDYTGRLVNNCVMCGNFEDMNIWVKPL